MNSYDYKQNTKEKYGRKVHAAKAWLVAVRGVCMLGKRIDNVYGVAVVNASFYADYLGYSVTSFRRSTNATNNDE